MMRPKVETEPEMAWCEQGGEFPVPAYRKPVYAEDDYAPENDAAQRTLVRSVCSLTEFDSGPPSDVSLSDMATAVGRLTSTVVILPSSEPPPEAPTTKLQPILPLKTFDKAAGPLAALALGFILGCTALVQDALEPAELTARATFVHEHKDKRDTAESLRDVFGPVVDVSSLERSHLRTPRPHAR